MFIIVSYLARQVCSSSSFSFLLEFLSVFSLPSPFSRLFRSSSRRDDPKLVRIIDETSLYEGARFLNKKPLRSSFLAGYATSAASFRRHFLHFTFSYVRQKSINGYIPIPFDVSVYFDISLGGKGIVGGTRERSFARFYESTRYVLSLLS